jgi:hypothetical protein
MAQRVPFTRLLSGGIGLLAALTLSQALAQDDKVKPPVFKHAMEVKVRKAGEKDFEKAPKTGVEVFLDPNTNRLVYLSEAGSIGVRPAPGSFEAKVQAPVWSHSMDLKVRKAGEDKFDDKTQKIGVEVYYDTNAGSLLYITDKGTIAVIPGKAISDKEKAKDPEFSHAMEISVRKAGEAKFTEKTRKVGVEVYFDPNTGNLIYLSETGSMAVQPGSKTTDASPKAPEWKAGMELRVRKSAEKFFNNDTVKHGVEVYKDENNGKMVFLSETGAIGVLSTPAAADPRKDPEWKYGLVVAARKAGEAEFTDKTRKVGIEVYTHEGTNSAIYITEGSNLAVIANK